MQPAEQNTTPEARQMSTTPDTHEITVEHRTNDYIAYLDGDKTRSETAPTTAEAVGKLVFSHNRKLGLTICAAMQLPDVTVLGSELRDNLGTRVLAGEGAPAWLPLGPRPGVIDPLTAFPERPRC